MELAILEAGYPPPDLAGRFGRYPAMFADLLGPGFEIVCYDVGAGRLPARPDAHRAYLVTGSRAGVYDPLPWIEPLERFLRAGRGRARLVGICFGHQVMAQAFGGRVAKSERGWGVGLQTYCVTARAPWMDDAAAVRVPVSHQDQVVELPPGAQVLASNAFSPFGMLAYADQPAISMQFHPEFHPDYAHALIESRREILADADAAQASLAGPNDRARVAQWIRNFLRG